jgi:hypothetical protein
VGEAAVSCTSRRRLARRASERHLDVVMAQAGEPGETANTAPGWRGHTPQVKTCCTTLVRGVRFAKVVEDGGEVRKLPRHVREQIVDALGEEFAAKGLKRDCEPHAYGLELAALTDACSVAWDDSATPLRDQHDARAC